MIGIGRPAPEIPTEAYVRGEHDPRTITLSEYRGRWLVLFFYPRDFTFVCPTEIQAFAELEPQFEDLHAEVIAASTDSYFSHKAWFERDSRLAGVCFPVLADTSHQLADAFGVLLEDGTALRGTFIFDPDGMLRSMQINDLDVGRNVEETVRTIAALRTGQLCPADWRPGELTLTQQLAAQAA
jgi:peroxiredoxin (alkyl hydroperoxide reductase subunit C)